MFILRKKFYLDNSLKTALQILTLSFALINLSCASSQKGKVLESMSYGALLGGAYGNGRPEFKSENAMLFAALGAVTGAIIGIYKEDPDLKISDLQNKVDAMTRLEKERTSEQTQIQEKSLGTLNSIEVGQLKKRGWREQKIDAYFQVAPNFIYHSQGIITTDEKSLLDE
jgi:hypothetical protein